MIGLERQFHDRPSLLGAWLLHQPPTVSGKRILPRGLAALRRPDQVREDAMNPVFVALVLHCHTLRLLIALLSG
jgi:hypothetical protein